MHDYADAIGNTGLREKAYAAVDVGDGMLDVWRQTMREPSPPNPKDRKPSSPNLIQRRYRAGLASASLSNPAMFCQYSQSATAARCSTACTAV
jgi:hypothetical protein